MGIVRIMEKDIHTIFLEQLIYFRVEVLLLFHLQIQPIIFKI